MIHDLITAFLVAFVAVTALGDADKDVEVDGRHADRSKQIGAHLNGELRSP
jgi:hypothetical protein